MKMLLSEVAKQTGGVLSGEDLNISSVSIDTRSLAKGDLYIAIKGENFDGHAFVDQAEMAGANAVLVEKKCNTALPQIVVNDSHLALAELAAAWKKQSRLKQ